MKKNLFLIRHRLEAITLIPLLKLQKVSVNLYQSNDRRMNLVVGEDGRGKSQNKLQLLIDEFQPDRIINFGIAGSLSKDLPLGSLVQGDGIHHFSDENSNILPVTYCVIPQSIAPVYPLLTLKKTDPTLCRNELPQPVVLLDMEGAYYAK